MPTPREELLARTRRALEHALEPILDLLRDADVTDILLNPDGAVWIDSHRDGTRDTGRRLEPDRVAQFLSLLATAHDTEITPDRPRLAAELPLDGSRVQGFLPPVVSAPSAAIRKRPTQIYSLAELEAQGVLDAPAVAVLRHSLAERRNVVVSGATGAGKTTLTNALLAAMVELVDPSERFVVLEDTAELQCAARNLLTLRTSDSVSLRDLVRDTLRVNPRRIVVGEVRGAEAFDLLKAWNTGHAGGVATLHANSAAAALLRLEHLTQEAGVPPQRGLIAETVHRLVHIEGRGSARHVPEILAVSGLSPDGSYALEPLYRRRVAAP